MHTLSAYAIYELSDHEYELYVLTVLPLPFTSCSSNIAVAKGKVGHRRLLELWAERLAFPNVVKVKEEEPPPNHVYYSCFMPRVSLRVDVFSILTSSVHVTT